jgi:hypothetical protein
MDQYHFPCGCSITEDAHGVITTKRCDEHKKKFPHRLDKEK